MATKTLPTHLKKVLKDKKRVAEFDKFLKKKAKEEKKKLQKLGFKQIKGTNMFKKVKK